MLPSNFPRPLFRKHANPLSVAFRPKQRRYVSLFEMSEEERGQLLPKLAGMGNFLDLSFSAIPQQQIKTALGVSRLLRARNLASKATAAGNHSKALALFPAARQQELTDKLQKGSGRLLSSITNPVTGHTTTDALGKFQQIGVTAEDLQKQISLLSAAAKGGITEPIDIALYPRIRDFQNQLRQIKSNIPIDSWADADAIRYARQYMKGLSSSHASDVSRAATQANIHKSLFRDPRQPNAGGLTWPVVPYAQAPQKITLHPSLRHRPATTAEQPVIPNDTTHTLFHEVGHAVHPNYLRFLGRFNTSKPSLISLGTNYDERIMPLESFADSFGGNMTVRYLQAQHIRRYGKPMSQAQAQALAQEMKVQYANNGGKNTNTVIPDTYQWNATGNPINDTKTLTDQLGTDIPLAHQYLTNWRQSLQKLMSLRRLQ